VTPSDPNERCGQCRWHDGAFCRLNPPVVRVYIERGDRQSTEEVTEHWPPPEVTAHWPPTEPTDWCGQFVSAQDFSR